MDFPKLRDRAKSEAEITNEIRAYLRSKNILHWKEHQGLGSVRGAPDIIGCIKGRLIAIEVKTKNGKPSPYQECFIEAIRYAGGIAFIARSVEDVESALNGI